MRITIFTYDREEMLKSLLNELADKRHFKHIVDDGSPWAKERSLTSDTVYHQRLAHAGKQGFWMRWAQAHIACMDSYDDWFLFLADDVKDINMEAIEALTKQGWHNSLVAFNVVNDGRANCWGPYKTGQKDIEVSGIKYHEVGFVDCGFLTNRHTLSQITIDPVDPKRFDNTALSSGVGKQLTLKFRELRVKMMNPTPSLCYHGDHPSKMHPEERKNTPLISK